MSAGVRSCRCTEWAKRPPPLLHNTARSGVATDQTQPSAQCQSSNTGHLSKAIRQAVRNTRPRRRCQDILRRPRREKDHAPFPCHRSSGPVRRRGSGTPEQIPVRRSRPTRGGARRQSLALTAGRPTRRGTSDDNRPPAARTVASITIIGTWAKLQRRNQPGDQRGPAVPGPAKPSPQPMQPGQLSDFVHQGACRPEVSG